RPSTKPTVLPASGPSSLSAKASVTSTSPKRNLRPSASPVTTTSASPPETLSGWPVATSMDTREASSIVLAASLPESVPAPSVHPTAASATATPTHRARCISPPPITTRREYGAGAPSLASKLGLDPGALGADRRRLPVAGVDHRVVRQGQEPLG